MNRIPVPAVAAVTAAAALMLTAALTIPGGAASAAMSCKPGHGHCPSPSPSPTGTSPSPSPTGTSPSPSPSPTGTSPSPSPSPTGTSPSPSPSPTGTSPSPSPTGTSPPCIVTATFSSNPGDQCTFPADQYPQIQGASVTRLGNDMWNPVPGASLMLTAHSPGDWTDSVNMPAGNSAVVAYPSLDADFHVPVDPWPSRPLSDFTVITSSFSETMNATPDTIASAAYDLLFDNSGTVNEVMIHHDLSNRGGDCSVPWAAQNVTFGGSNGVPVRSDWNLCVDGTSAFWQVPRADSFSTGSVDVMAMLQYLISHGYMAATAQIGDFGYGWEVCSTGGVNEDFRVSSFSITAR